ncbi:antibiotic biosynthesis monooxygenase (ABM) superfamily enzyme [Mycetocola sp. CAN_C7]|uniref:antibiotic biosynthesis monooxygenase n=1 Tax=Mycetocola sp. CAN_C7 TaxID=2787724 RepID=UPI0018CB6032
MEHQPITVSIERRVNPERIAEATAWVQSGIRMAGAFPGFLGSGWVRAGARSETWHMLYRFTDESTLEAWEDSDQRTHWLSDGREFMEQSRVEKRTGIEGWFDEPSEQQATAASAVTPPRWKQATSIWLGFFPLNLAFTVLVTAFIPGWDELGVFLHVLISTLTLAPIMTFWVLPFVTRLLRGWLHAPRRRLGVVELSPR